MAWVFYVFGATCGAALLVMLWSLLEPRRFRIRRLRLSSDDCALPPLRILHLTDTHFSGRDEPILRFLRRIAGEAEYDLVVFTGDLIHRAAGIPSLAEAASLFEPTLGSFAVLGGHDHTNMNALITWRHLITGRRLKELCPPNPVEEVIAALEGAGVETLQDENRRLKAPDGSPFAIVGLRDAYDFDPDWEAAWSGIAPDVPVLALSHSPDALPEAAARRTDLMLSGHTHGGQVRLPLIGALITYTDIGRRAARGAFRYKDTALLVSSGLGASPATPFRLLCPPTAFVIRTAVAPGAASHLKELRLDE